MQDLVTYSEPGAVAKQKTVRAVLDELVNARKKHPTGMRSAHEGFAILKEEVDELWDEVKKDSPNWVLFAEAKQVAAMALRFCIEVANGGENDTRKKV